MTTQAERDDPFTEDEWRQMRAYVNGHGHRLPKFIEDDPRRHFARWVAHWDRQEKQRLLAEQSPPQRISADTEPRAAVRDPELTELLRRAKELVDRMTPEEREAHFAEQRANWVRAEMAMGDEGTRVVIQPVSPSPTIPGEEIARWRDWYNTHHRAQVEEENECGPERFQTAERSALYYCGRMLDYIQANSARPKVPSRDDIAQVIEHAMHCVDLAAGKRPSIAELEAMLNSADPPRISLLPDGSITAGEPREAAYKAADAIMALLEGRQAT